ncbi:MAG: tellurite resistance TerB family protein [Cyanobium sp.]
MSTGTMEKQVMAQSDGASGSEKSAMAAPEAFLAIALAAVSWDGVLSPAGTRALRHAIDYRHPYVDLADQDVALMIDGLLGRLRSQGAQQLMLRAAAGLTPELRRTAFATAAEIMRSDGPLQADEQNILSTLAATLELPEADSTPLLDVMEVLHAPVQ